MKNFWPNRSRAKGFSIERFVRKHGDKIHKISFAEMSKQLVDERNLKSIEGDRKKRIMQKSSKKNGHWANRDFSEYREAA